MLRRRLCNRRWHCCCRLDLSNCWLSRGLLRPLCCRTFKVAAAAWCVLCSDHGLLRRSVCTWAMSLRLRGLNFWLTQVTRQCAIGLFRIPVLTAAITAIAITRATFTALFTLTGLRACWHIHASVTIRLQWCILDHAQRRSVLQPGLFHATLVTPIALAFTAFAWITAVAVATSALAFTLRCAHIASVVLRLRFLARLTRHLAVLLHAALWTWSTFRTLLALLTLYTLCLATLWTVAVTALIAVIAALAWFIAIRALCTVLT